MPIGDIWEIKVFARLECHDISFKYEVFPLIVKYSDAILTKLCKYVGHFWWNAKCIQTRGQKVFVILGPKVPPKGIVNVPNISC